MAREGKITTREAQRALRTSGPAIENFEASIDVEPSKKDEKQPVGIDTFECVNTLQWKKSMDLLRDAYNPKGDRVKREPTMSEGYRLAHLMNVLENYLNEHLSPIDLSITHNWKVFTSPIMRLEDLCLPSNYANFVLFDTNAVCLDAIEDFLNRRFVQSEDAVESAFREAVLTVSDPNVLLMMIAWSRILPPLITTLVPPPYGGLVSLLAQLLIGILQKWCESMISNDTDMTEVRKRLDYYPVLRDDLLSKGKLSEDNDVVVGADLFVEEISKFVPHDEEMETLSQPPTPIVGSGYSPYTTSSVVKSCVAYLFEVFLILFFFTYHRIPNVVAHKGFVYLSATLDFCKFFVLIMYTIFIELFVVPTTRVKDEYKISLEEMRPQSGTPTRIDLSPINSPDRKGSVCHSPEELIKQLNALLALPPPQETQPKVESMPMRPQASWLRKTTSFFVVYCIIALVCVEIVRAVVTAYAMLYHIIWFLYNRALGKKVELTDFRFEVEDNPNDMIIIRRELGDEIFSQFFTAEVIVTKKKNVQPLRVVFGGDDMVIRTLGVDEPEEKNDDASLPDLVRAEERYRVVNNPDLIVQSNPPAPMEPIPVEKLPSESLSFIRELSDLMATSGAKEDDMFVEFMISGASVYMQPTTSRAIFEAMRLIRRYWNDVPSEFDKKLRELLPASESMEKQNFGFEGNPLLAAFMSLISSLSLATLASKAGVSVGFDSFAKAKTMLDDMAATKGDNILAKFFQFLKSLATKLIECIKAKSWDPLFEKSMSQNDWIKVSRVLLEDERIRHGSNKVKFELGKSDGSIPAFFIDQLTEDMRARVALYLVQGSTTFLKRSTTLNEDVLGVLSDILKLKASLQKFILEEANRKTRGQYRAKAPGFYIHGKTSVGKSTLGSALGAIVASYEGATYGSDITYYVEVGQNYWDGVSVGHCLFILDDQDQKAGKPQYSDRTYVSVSFELLNTRPCNAEKADVDEKGKVFLNATCVLMFTNDPPTKKKLDGLIRYPETFYRRYEYSVEMIVNSKYATEIGSLKEGVTIEEDTWIFKLGRFNPPSNLNTTEVDYYEHIETFTTRLDFLKRFSAIYGSYVANREKFARMMNLDVGPCSICRLPNSVHVVPCALKPENCVMVVQSAEPVAEPVETRVVYRMTTKSKILGCAVTCFLLHFVWLVVNYWFFVAGLEALIVFSLICIQDVKVVQDWIMLAVLTRSPMGFSLGYLTHKFIPLERRSEFASRFVSNDIFVKLEQYMPTLRGIVCVILAIIGSKWISAKITEYFKNPKRVEYETQAFIGESDDREPVVVKSGKPDHWIRIPTISTTYPQKISTSDFPALASTMFKCYAEISRNIIEGYTPASVNMFHLKGCIWLCPKHFFLEPANAQFRGSPVADVDMKCTINYNAQDHFVMIRKGKNLVASENRDYVLLYLPSIPTTSDGVYDFVPQDSLPASTIMDAFVLMRPDYSKNGVAITPVMSESKASFVLHSATALYGALPWISYKLEAKLGDCGSCGFGKLGNKIYLVSSHSLGSKFGDESERVLRTCFGEELLKREIDPLITDLDRMTLIKSYDVFVPQSGQLSRKPLEEGFLTDIKLKDTPPKSSIASVLADGNFPVALLGTIPKFHASSFNSEHYETPWRGRMDELARKYEITPNYVLPKEKSGMRDEKHPDGVTGLRWCDPYTYNMRKSANIFGPTDPMDWAVGDYLEDLRHYKNELSNVRPLSMYEAFKGDMSGWVNPVNLKTSTGLPFNQPKGKVVRWIMEEAEKLGVEVSDVVLESIRVAVRLLLEGYTPQFVFSATEKDEPISIDKELRIFKVGPLVYHIVLTMFAGPIVGFLTNHNMVAEMAIGMNPCSTEQDIIMAQRKQYAEGQEPSTIDGDLSGQDIRTSTQSMEGGCTVILGIADWTAYTKEEKDILRRLLTCAYHRIEIVKGDVYVVCFQNPSGWLLTAIINSINNALWQRCSLYLAYMEISPGSAVPKYKEVAFALNLGDDNEITVKPKYREYLNMLTLQRGFAKYGQIYTDSNKSAIITDLFHDLSETTFLKRKHRFDEEVRHWMSPLELKSIFKMLSFGKKSKDLSMVNVLKQTAQSAVYELFFHGREAYDRLSAELKETINDELILGEVPSFDFFKEKYLKGEASWTWDDPIAVVSYEMIVQSSPGVPAGALNEFANQEIVDSKTDIKISDPLPVQFKEVNQLSQFFQRDAKIGSTSLASTNTYGQLIAQIDVLKLWLALTPVVSKTNNYWFFKCKSLKLTVMGECAPTTYGGYLVSWVFKNRGGSSITVDTCSPPNMFSAMQTNYAIFNPAMSNDITFEIPFVHALDAALIDVDSDEDRCYPELRVYCIAALREANDLTALPTGSLTYFLRADPTFELGGVIPQGKYPKRISSMLSQAAAGSAALSSVPALAPYSTPISMGLSAASELASAMGFTRHRDAKNVDMMRNLRVTDLGPMDGSDSSISTGLTHGAITSVDTNVISVGDGTDETSFAYLFPRDTLYQAYAWSSTSVAGVVLASIPVTPGLCATSAGNFVPTPCGFFGATCEWWRGPMEYTLHFLAGQLHSGAVTVFWSRTPYTEGSTMTSDPTLTSHSCFIDISSDLTKTIRVDWNTYRPMCRMRLNAPINTINADEVNGYLIVAVAAPIRGATIPCDINFTVAMRASAEMVVGGLRMFNSYNNFSSVENNLRFQATLGDEVPNDTCYLTGAPRPPPALQDIFLGELIGSARALAQKFSVVQETQIIYVDNIQREIFFTLPMYPPAAGSSFTANHYGNSPGYTPKSLSVSTLNVITATYGSAATDMPFNMLGYLKTAFLGIRGGMLYKIVPTAQAGASEPYYISEIGAGAYTGAGTTGLVQGFNWYWSANLARQFPPASPVGTLQGGAEFYIPYSSYKKFECAFLPTANDICRRVVFNINMRTTTANSGAAFRIFAAGAADINFVKFRHTPILNGTGPF